VAKIKVLIVDDSAVVRQVLTTILNSKPDIEVVGTAADPFIAREKIKKLNPDVLTLDIEMPRMDGVTFLGNLMRLRPMPVVMISTLTEKGADVTLRALAYGAVDYISKPKIGVKDDLQEYAEEIIEKVRIASRARVRTLKKRPVIHQKLIDTKLSTDAVLDKITGKWHFSTTTRIIGIGSSTGGTEAIKDVLAPLPPDMPGIVICQHLPAAFIKSFAIHLNSITNLIVQEAKENQQVVPGHVYIAPGNKHLIIERDGARYICRINDGPEVNRHKPSVDVMMRSLAQNAGSNAIGLMLTGMGDDGVEGMGELKRAGGTVVIQDEKSCVVWGMPGQVYKRGYADEVLSLTKIPDRLIELARL